MTLTNTWGIAALDRNTADGKVTTIHWTLSATDGTNTTGSYGSIGVDGDLKVPYADLTKDIVIGWVKAQLGGEKVAEMEKAAAAQLAEQAAPTHATGVPW
ncbi:MAG: hypothetical protein LW834_12045 [Cyanobium sp. 49614_E6]|jgi:hypothetical protein|nr:hypothetical protein [Cyanobium sp. 49614_E6]MCE2837673.1 hypothetical protein [Cyanobium sp. 49614_E6]